MVYNLKKMSVLVLLTSSLFSCVSANKLSKELDAEGKTFVTKADKANLYIFRDEILGGAVGMPVDVNGKMIGKTVAGTYILASFEPGTLNIVSHAENDSQISIDAKAGTNYYVWQEVKMGILYARNKLQQVSEEDAKKRIGKCERVGIPEVPVAPPATAAPAQVTKQP
jgi:hypothetical protein